MPHPPDQPPFLSELQSRDLLRDLTVDAPEPDFRARPILYVGFDPTATSLHAGSLMPLLTMDRFRVRGGQIIALMGGATGLIGDPSGRDQERVLQGSEVVQERVDSIQAQVRTFFEHTDGPEPIFVNNADWCGEVDIVTFLRDVGKHFSVNQMLARDSVKSRIDRDGAGISFTEFSYQLLQAFDFLHLFRTFGCQWQMGASDQWGNIVSGVDLIRRVTSEKVHGLTIPLLTNAEGKKYGKSVSGTIWLDPALTSPYAFYQFWMNTSDADMSRFLHWLTSFSQDEIADLLATPPSQRQAQRALADVLVRRVHGDDQALLARQASEIMFSNRFDNISPATIDMLRLTVPTLDPREGQTLTLGESLLALGAVRSKSEALRLVKQGSVRVNGHRVGSLDVDLRDWGSGRSAVVVSTGPARRFLVRLAPANLSEGFGSA
jgi:tyrosyl-tRNA synthetase